MADTKQGDKEKELIEAAIHPAGLTDSSSYDEEDMRLSFRAGRKEVVDFAGAEPFEHSYDCRVYNANQYHCKACRWQVKLAEWGLL